MKHYPVSQPYTGAREAARLAAVLARNQFSNGPEVLEFERAFAGWVGTAHAVSAMNGTVALHLALLGMGIGPGDEVIVPSLTFVATANAVAYTGATPVFVDVDPRTWCMDPKAFEKAITPKTRGVIPVHLYGVMADLDTIWDIVLDRITKDHTIWVIEDAAEAHGAMWREFKAGFIGDAGVFSFFGNKILTCGEGGMITTDDDDAAARMRFLRGQGMDPARRYYHPEIGYNYRMTEMQAALGNAQLEDADAHVDARREVYGWYFERLREEFVEMQHGAVDQKPARWMTTVLLPERINRSAVMARLDLRGIETRPAFPQVHTMPMYEDLQTELPVTLDISQRGLCLPTYRGLTEDDVDYICRELVTVLRDGGSQ